MRTGSGTAPPSEQREKLASRPKRPVSRRPDKSRRRHMAAADLSAHVTRFAVAQDRSPGATESPLSPRRIARKAACNQAKRSRTGVLRHARAGIMNAIHPQLRREVQNFAVGIALERPDAPQVPGPGSAVGAHPSFAVETRPYRPWRKGRHSKWTRTGLKAPTATRTRGDPDSQKFPPWRRLMASAS